MKIALVISAITAGGAERVMVNLANEWSARGRSVCLITADDGTSPPFYPLDKSIEHRTLDVLKPSHSILGSVVNNVRYLLALRAAFKASNPDVAISFITESNVRTLLASVGLQLPVLVSERNDPLRQRRHPIWRILCRFLYPHAERVVIQTAAVEDALTYVPRRRLAVIPNPVSVPERHGEVPQKPGRPLILAVGRLEHQKGFDLLLQAFAQFRKKYPQWELLVLGEGSKREDLLELCRTLELEDSVSLPGLVNDISRYFYMADIFALSSRYEGMPNALCEAMAAGVAAVATDCSSGPRELIEHERNGLLVPSENIDALADAFIKLADDPSLRQRLGREAKRVSTTYALQNVVGRWEEEIENVRGERRRAREGGDVTSFPLRKSLR